MKYYSFNYSLKVWLTSVLAAPVLYSIAQHYLQLHQDDDGSILQVYPIIIMIEAGLSFAGWLVFWGITALSQRFLAGSTRKKNLLFAVGMLLTINVFVLSPLRNGDFAFNDIAFDLMLCNCLCVGAGCFIFRLEPPLSGNLDLIETPNDTGNQKHRL